MQSYGIHRRFSVMIVGLVIIVLCSTLTLSQPTRSQAEFADAVATAVGTPTQQFQTFLPLTQAAPAVNPAPDPAPTTTTTLLASYVISPYPEYAVTQYTPRGFTAEPYVDWDVLGLPGKFINDGINTTLSNADWLTLQLNRSAALAVVWRGQLDPPDWLSDWELADDVVVDGTTYPTYRKDLPAGEVVLGGVNNPGVDTSQPTYLVLFAEADGSPSSAPPAPEGREIPQPNQPCPQWVHDQYVTTGPDGKLYPTWHPQIDPVYWCYFEHEHGSDPDLFVAGYRPPYGYVSAQTEAKPELSSNFLCDVETFEAAANIVLSPEPHVGFKSYAFDDANGHRWLITHHFGTASLKRVCVRFHSVHVVVADAATEEIVADIHLMGDFGKSVVNTTSEDLIPVECPDQALLSDNANSQGIRRMPVATRESIGYEPWRLDDNGIVFGFDSAALTFNTPGAIVICNDITCEQGIETGNKGEFRFFSYTAGFGISASEHSGIFYTDPYAQQIVAADAVGTVRQFVAPGLQIDIPGFDGENFFPTDPWHVWYEPMYNPGPTSSDMNLEGALNSPN
ncbi:MAG: hypothetical protein MI924_16450 [Chloroflexales bacterium]|nr:hypothetical protein [Chloroflexales bacterium]